MKNKFAIINISLVIAVLFSMLFQSLHSYEHLLEKNSQEKCHQKHIGSGTQLTHQHYNLEHCFACEFTFSNFISSDFFTFEFKKVTLLSYYSFFNSKEIINFFKGSLFALRAPPIFIA